MPIRPPAPAKAPVAMSMDEGFRAGIAEGDEIAGGLFEDDYFEEIEAPLAAKHAQAGQFVIFRLEPYSCCFLFHFQCPPVASCCFHSRIDCLSPPWLRRVSPVSLLLCSDPTSGHPSGSLHLQDFNPPYCFRRGGQTSQVRLYSFARSPRSIAPGGIPSDSLIVRFLLPAT